MADDHDENRLAHAVSVTLFSGLTVSVILILLGWFFAGRTEPPENTHIRGVLALPSRAVHGDGTAILELGLLVLMLTPVARVLILAIGWARTKDWTFSLIAFFVLALLALSVLLGTG
jgi:uncharacterized membrane protein